MWSAAILRFVRRRIVLGIIFSLSFTYCIVSLIKDGKPSLNPDEPELILRSEPFKWRTLQEHNTSADIILCRNSVQGKVLIVDDEGYVCPRGEILSSGCCNTESTNTVQYACETCKKNHCCAIYEYCISCCLHPNKRNLLETFLGKAAEQNNVLFASVKDHFELCLAKCRTNSQSVQHENSYRDPRAKHCYGDLAPSDTSNENNKIDKT